MCDESLSSLDSIVQQMSEAEYQQALNDKYRQGYIQGLCERYRYTHLLALLKNKFRGWFLCDVCMKPMWFKKRIKIYNGYHVCSKKCEREWLPF